MYSSGFFDSIRSENHHCLLLAEGEQDTECVKLTADGMQIQEAYS